MFWDHARCQGPKQNARNISHKRMGTEVVCFWANPLPSSVRTRTSCVNVPLSDGRADAPQSAATLRSPPPGRNQWGRNPSVRPTRRSLQNFGWDHHTHPRLWLRQLVSWHRLWSIILSFRWDQHKEHSVAFYKHATSRPLRRPYLNYVYTERGKGVTQMQT